MCIKCMGFDNLACNLTKVTLLVASLSSGIWDLVGNLTPSQWIRNSCVTNKSSSIDDEFKQYKMRIKTHHDPSDDAT